MSELEYDKNYPVWLKEADITPPTDPISIKGTIKAILEHVQSLGSSTLLGRTQYAPASVDTSSTVVSSTGLTSVYFTTGHDQAVTFVAPLSGNVLFRMNAFVKGGAAAASSTVFGIVSTTQATSPGTVVGVLGLAQLTPTGTAADNGEYVSMVQLITGLTAAQSYTWYGAAMYSGTATTILAQGTTSQTTVPTGAPYVVEVWAA